MSDRLRCYMQEYCTDRGMAVALAPQVSEHFAEEGRKKIKNTKHRNQMAHVWVPVCRGHLDGWWDSSDAGVKRLPAFTVSTNTVVSTAAQQRRATTL